MKTTQLYRKHNGVLALHYITMTLVWLSVISSLHYVTLKLGP